MSNVGEITARRRVVAGILENNRHNVTTRGKIEEFGGFNRHINRNVTDR